MGSVNWRKRGNRYQVAWRLDDGSQGAKTVATKAVSYTHLTLPTNREV